MNNTIDGTYPIINVLLLAYEHLILPIIDKLRNLTTRLIRVQYDAPLLTLVR